MIVKEMREREEHRRSIVIVGQGSQGAMNRWEVPEHMEILGTTESRIKFLTRAVCDLLPTPACKSKLFGEDKRCNLYNERHIEPYMRILVECKTALSQGRYTSRHNKVLQELFEKVSEKPKSATTVHTTTMKYSLCERRY